MSIFGKTEIICREIPFILDETHINSDGCCLIDIEAETETDGEKKYLNASYELKKGEMYNNGDYEEMIELLKNSEDKKITAELKFRGKKLKSFKFSTESLAKVYNDERFLMLDLLVWGINDKSCREDS